MKRLWLVLGLAAVLIAVCLGARMTVDTLLLNSDAAVQAAIQAKEENDIQTAVRYAEQAHGYWQQRSGALALLFSKDLLEEMDAALQNLQVALRAGEAYETGIAQAEYRSVRDAMHSTMHEIL